MAYSDGALEYCNFKGLPGTNEMKLFEGVFEEVATTTGEPSVNNPDDDGDDECSQLNVCPFLTI